GKIPRSRCVGPATIQPEFRRPRVAETRPGQGRCRPGTGQGRSRGTATARGCPAQGRGRGATRRAGTPQGLEESVIDSRSGDRVPPPGPMRVREDGPSNRPGVPGKPDTLARTKISLGNTAAIPGGG